ncbi:MAG: hypothetical protein C4K60_14220 [Ideonella sp. MAG2]|nr:MAG: hypothetical protein C4K60_14220 [Ideonella sp. MAG2]
MLRRKSPPPAAAPRQARPTASASARSAPVALASVDIPLDDAAPRSPAPSGTPQQRLLERLREQNIEIAAQAKAAADQHARLMSERQQEQQAENLRRDRQVEELRQNHSADFSHLLGVVFEQMDRVQVAHHAQAQALSQELDRLRRLAQDTDRGGLADDNTVLDDPLSRQRLESAARDVRQAEFEATRAFESLREPR